MAQQLLSPQPHERPQRVQGAGRNAMPRCYQSYEVEEKTWAAEGHHCLPYFEAQMFKGNFVSLHS